MYLNDPFLGKKSCNLKHGLDNKNEFEKWPHITFFIRRYERLIECSGTDYSCLPLFTCSCKNGMTVLPCIYESTV